jgi:arylsulfatase A-like enzyme
MPYYENNDPQIKYWDGFSPFSIAEDANSYITEHAKKDNPFLLFVSIATPHFPHDTAPQEFMDLYPQSQLTLPPNVPDEWKIEARQELQGYYAQCTVSDQAIGSILNKIKELGLWEDTIIVYTADHGEMMGAHGVKPFAKQLAWDESIKVPFLISYPSIRENKGKVINAPINTPDILPSLLGLSNIKIPKSIEGEDISKLIISPNPDIDRNALVMSICPFDLEHGFQEYRAIRTKQYTYASTPESPTMLFDNIKDPYQLNNLLGNSDFEALQKELDIKLKKALKQIGDENFKYRDYYLKKWNFKLNDKNQAIDFLDFIDGKGTVQTPKLN